MSDRRPFVGGNWKMNTSLRSASELARGVADALVSLHGVEVVLYPPYPYLLAVGSILRDRADAIGLGAQDAWPEPDGAFTGEVSITMLEDCHAHSILVGHSERRHVIEEPEEVINAKTKAVLASGNQCVLCVGETLEQRKAGEADAVNERQVRSALAGVRDDAQLENLVIAYEPVWAIGTGQTATPDDAQRAHERIRALIGTLYGSAIAARLRIIYGGSVKPSNAAELFAQPDIDGGLIGGASLKIGDFAAIAKTAGGSPSEG